MFEGPGAAAGWVWGKIPKWMRWMIRLLVVLTGKFLKVGAMAVFNGVKMAAVGTYTMTTALLSSDDDDSDDSDCEDDDDDSDDEDDSDDDDDANAPTKKVSFSKAISCRPYLHVNNYSQEEVDSCWWSIEEEDAMRCRDDMMEDEDDEEENIDEEELLGSVYENGRRRSARRLA